MKPNQELELNKVNTTAKIKGLYPSGQAGYAETHYLIETKAGNITLSASLVNLLFQLKEEKKEEPKAKLSKKEVIKINIAELSDEASKKKKVEEQITALRSQLKATIK